MSADMNYPPELVPDGTDSQEELWDSSSEEEAPVLYGTETKRVTLRASPFIQSTYHCFCVVVYVGIKTYEATIFRTIPQDKLDTNFRGWYTFGARWKYLTYLNLWLQFVYFFLAFFTDVVPFSPLTPRLRTLSHVLYSTIAFPLGIFVVITFWGVYWVDPDLIWPKAVSDYLPPLLNHSWHTAVGVLILLEGVLVPHEYLALMPTAFIVSSAAALYVIWVMVVRVMSGAWVYHMLAVVPLPLKPVFFLCFTWLLLLFAFVGYLLNRVLWTEEIPVKLKKV